MSFFRNISIRGFSCAALMGLATVSTLVQAEQVKGGNVTFVLCRGGGAQQYALAEGQSWIKRFANGNSESLRETNRDEWSVYLEGQNVQIQLDLFKKACIVTNRSGNGNTNTIEVAAALRN